MSSKPSIGFIGLGVMGEPMCRNLAQKSGAAVIAFDLSPDPLARLAAHGVRAAASVADLASRADVILVALPGGPQLQAVCDAGLLEHARPGQIVVDCGTSPVALTRALAAAFAAKGARYADAPIARTREAAEQGTLSIMVGAVGDTFAAIRPYLACCASEITHCGEIGAGQVVKLMNNMVLFQTVVALCEALAIAKQAGVDSKILFETLTKGSADSFALRNHAMKAILPDRFPERAFSVEYARKDLSYALALAQEFGLTLPGATTAELLLQQASEAGYGANYWPVIARLISGNPVTPA